MTHPYREALCTECGLRAPHERQLLCAVCAAAVVERIRASLEIALREHRLAEFLTLPPPRLLE